MLIDAFDGYVVLGQRLAAFNVVYRLTSFPLAVVFELIKIFSIFIFKIKFIIKY